MLEAARKAGIPVIHTNVEFLPGGFNGGESRFLIYIPLGQACSPLPCTCSLYMSGIFFRKIPLLKIFEKGSPLGAFPEVLQPLPTELVVTKNYASAFFGTSLASTLTAHGIDTLLIAGVSTSGCVRYVRGSTEEGVFLLLGGYQ
jgi:maleamate amidohydrolase